MSLSNCRAGTRPSYQYTMAAGQMIFGSADVYSGGTGYSKESCEMKCDTTPSCKSYVFGKSAGRCEMWSKGKGCGCLRATTYGYDTYFKTARTHAPTAAPGAPRAHKTNTHARAHKSTGAKEHRSRPLSPGPTTRPRPRPA